VTSTPVVTSPSTPVATAPSAPVPSNLVGTAGNNLLAASSGGGLLDGKEGIDTVVFGSQRSQLRAV
jgi:hypothetical protein